MGISYPLEGIRVIGLEQYVAAPDCTLWLANAGAEVIKLERPGGGEPRRTYLPVVEDAKGNKAFGGFMIYNRYKKSLTLDLQAEKGKQIYKELIKHADVVVENFAPGAVDRLGLGYDVLQQINPRLVYAAMSGFGRLKEFSGIYSQRPAFDPVIQAMAGITDQIGEEGGPPPYGFPGFADLYASIVTAYAIMLALFMREKTGPGSVEPCRFQGCRAAAARRSYRTHWSALRRGVGVVERGALHRESSLRDRTSAHAV